MKIGHFKIKPVSICPRHVPANDYHSPGPAQSPFAEFTPSRKGAELPQQFAAFVKKLIAQKHLKPGEKILPSEILAHYFRAQGFPIAPNTLILGLQKVARDGKIVYLNGRGLKNQGPGYYVFDPAKHSFLEILQTAPLPVLGKGHTRAAIIRDILENRIKPQTPLPLDHRLNLLLGVKNHQTPWHLIARLRRDGFLVRDAKRIGRQNIYRAAPREVWLGFIQRQVQTLLQSIAETGFSQTQARTILAVAAHIKPEPSIAQASPSLRGIAMEELAGKIKTLLEEAPARKKKYCLGDFLRNLIFSGALPAGANLPGPFYFTRVAGRRFQGLIYAAMMQLVEDGLLLPAKTVKRGQFQIASQQITFARAVKSARNHLQEMALLGYDLSVLKPLIRDLLAT